MTRSIETLATDLRRLGVGAGHCLMVHASMRAVGPVERGAVGVIEAIEAVIGPDGSILMILGAVDDHAWVNDEAEDARAALLADAQPFDALRTSADPDMGVLAEVFRTMPGTVVSDHPEARFGARGRLALEFTRAVPWGDYYGADSPLERFVAQGGGVLRLGADDNTTTLMHYSEQLAAVPAPKHRVRRHRRFIRDGEPVIGVIDTLDDTDGIADYDLGAYDPADFDASCIDSATGRIDEFAVVLHDYRRSDGVRTGPVGATDAELFDADAFVAFATKWIEAHALH